MFTKTLTYSYQTTHQANFQSLFLFFILQCSFFLSSGLYGTALLTHKSENATAFYLATIFFSEAEKKGNCCGKKEQNITLTQEELLAPVLPCAYLWTFGFLCLWCHAYLPRDPYLQSPASQRRRKNELIKNV